ncbi:transcription termination factor Rho-like [Teleopsis dalmanni]|uniref:transcription termination factor Rho-like n=1 Tax=Teleopsis dalmanni TaxID=139649 RepID=UPI0018CFBBCF|nr:transcription termination factor Rho-like [Teleopsis dalmanni]
MDLSEVKKIFNPNTTKGKTAIAGAAVATLTLTYLMYRMIRGDPKSCPCCTAEYLAAKKCKPKRPKLTYCPDKPKKCSKDKSAHGGASKSYDDGEHRHSSKEPSCGRDNRDDRDGGRHSDRSSNGYGDCGSGNRKHDQGYDQGSCNRGHHSTGHSAGTCNSHNDRSHHSGSSCPHENRGNDCSSGHHSQSGHHSRSGHHSSQGYEKQSCRD